MNFPIVNSNQTKYSLYGQKKTPSFCATPQQISEILRKPESTNLISLENREFLNKIVQFFYVMEYYLTKKTSPEAEFVYNLEAKNKIPSSLINIKADGALMPEIKTDKITLNQMDEYLNSKNLVMSKGRFINKLLNKLGVEEPNVIKISKKIEVQ